MFTATDLFSQALSLPPGEREELALLLFNSLPDDTPIEVSPELEQLIAKRTAEHAAGIGQTIDFDTFVARIRAAAKPLTTP